MTITTCQPEENNLYQTIPSQGEKFIKREKKIQILVINRASSSFLLKKSPKTELKANTVQVLSILKIVIFCYYFKNINHKL